MTNYTVIGLHAIYPFSSGRYDICSVISASLEWNRSLRIL